MPDYRSTEPVISGVGVTAAIGHGKDAFLSALLAGRHKFDVMRRHGRQWTPAPGGGEEMRNASTSYLGAELEAEALADYVPETMRRTASLSGQAALATLREAWADANLAEVDPDRVGLIIGGSNLQQREIVRMQDANAGRLRSLRPSYGMTFLDTDLCGLCTEAFGIRGFAHSVGGASASGQVAVIQAAQAVKCGQADVCIALGALTDLSYWECQGLRSMGAMGSDRYAERPDLACRPFDRNRDGFIFGECCGAVVVERAESRTRAHLRPYAHIRGWSTRVDGNRNPNPSVHGEVRVIEEALSLAGMSAGEIDYVNPHGSGSVLGDEIELQAIRQCGLERACLNTTKSIVGHGLCAAGAVEIVATLLQMRAGKLHPSRNLDEPLNPSCRWVLDRPVAHPVRRALKLSMGFGGLNSALCLESM